MELQKNTEEVHKIVIELEQYIENLKDIVEKFEALCDLNNLTLCDSTLTDNSSVMAISNSENSERSQLQTLKVLTGCYKEQTELNHTICENIGTASSLDHTVYYACIWTHQPAIGQQCFIAERQLALMLEMS